MLNKSGWIQKSRSRYQVALDEKTKNQPDQKKRSLEEKRLAIE